jgi:hypothetical protein
MKKDFEKKNKSSKVEENDKLPSLLNNSRYGIFFKLKIEN